MSKDSNTVLDDIIWETVGLDTQAALTPNLICNESRQGFAMTVFQGVSCNEHSRTHYVTHEL